MIKKKRIQIKYYGFEKPRVFSINIPADELQEIKKLCKKEKRSISNQVKSYLNRHFKTDNDLEIPEKIDREYLKSEETSLSSYLCEIIRMSEVGDETI